MVNCGCETARCTHPCGEIVCWIEQDYDDWKYETLRLGVRRDGLRCIRVRNEQRHAHQRRTGQVGPYHKQAMIRIKDDVEFEPRICSTCRTLGPGHQCMICGKFGLRHDECGWCRECSRREEKRWVEELRARTLGMVLENA